MSLLNFFARHIKPRKMRGRGMLHPAESSRINEDLWAFRQRDVNYWIVGGKGGKLAFDCGYQDYSEAEWDLARLGIEAGDIKAVFLTHADVDHAGGLLYQSGLFPKAKIYLHEKELPMLRGTAVRVKRGIFRLRNPLRFKGEVSLLEDGDVSELLGHRIETIFTPGHTPGHCCYLLDGRYLFTGDSMAFREDGGYGFFDFFNMDTAENLQSLEKLQKRLGGLIPELILTGHSGVFVPKGEEIFAKALQTAEGTRSRPFDPDAPYDCFTA